MRGRTVCFGRAQIIINCDDQFRFRKRKRDRKIDRDRVDNNFVNETKNFIVDEKTRTTRRKMKMKKGCGEIRDFS